MGLPVVLLTFLLLKSALSVTDDSLEGFELFGPEDEADPDSYAVAVRQNRGGDKFLRFGKAFWEYDVGNDATYDDREVPRPPRTGSLSGNNPQQRIPRDKSSFLRFGRSADGDDKKRRDKRDALPTSDALKRHENYLRFGRSPVSNFLRFGRGRDDALTKPNRHVLNYLRSLLRRRAEERGDI